MNKDKHVTQDIATDAAQALLVLHQAIGKRIGTDKDGNLPFDASVEGNMLASVMSFLSCAASDIERDGDPASLVVGLCMTLTGLANNLAGDLQNVDPVIETYNPHHIAAFVSALGDDAAVDEESHEGHGGSCGLTACTAQAEEESGDAPHGTPRCNCENAHCTDHEPGGCPSDGGKARVLDLGIVCDACAQLYADEYLITRLDGSAGGVGIVIAGEGRRIISTDYNGGEMKVVAELAGDELWSLNRFKEDRANLIDQIAAVDASIAHLQGKLTKDDDSPAGNEQFGDKAAWHHWLLHTPNLHASLGRDPDHQQEMALAELFARRGPPPSPSTVREIKNVLISRVERCSKSCPGWFINNETCKPEVCDECCRTLNVTNVYDEDVARLPEAQEEAAKVTVRMLLEGTAYFTANERLAKAKKPILVLSHEGSEVVISEKDDDELIRDTPEAAAAWLDGYATALATILG